MRTVSFVRRKFNAMLGVATVSMAVNFIVMLSGSLVAGNLLGKEGLAGISVCTPVFAVASFLGSLISVGAGLVFSQAMGEYDERRAAGIWSQSAGLALGLGAFIFLAMAAGGELFMDFNGVTGEIRAEAASYWRWHAVSMGLTPVLLLVMAMVYADGDGMVAMCAGGCYVVGTLLFSVLLTLLSGHAGGISGGTALTIVIVLAVSSLHFLRKNNHLKFVRYFSFRDLGRTVLRSAPDATIYLCWGLLALVVNRFTVVRFGEELLAVVALGVSVVQFSIVFDGVGEALIPLGGMYAGERNNPALRELATHSALVATGEGVLVGLVLLAFASPIATAYGFRGEAEKLLPQAVGVVRSLALAMPFMGFLMMANTHYLVVGHVKLAVSVTVLKDFVLSGLFTLLFGAVLGFGGLWIGMVAGYAVAAAYPFLFVRLVHGRDRFPWLVGRDGAAVDFAIRLDRESLFAARDRIADFLRRGGVGDDVVGRVMDSVEKNGLAAVEKNAADRPCVEYFVSLAEPGMVRMIVRDDGVTMETPFRALSENRYLNTLNCNRTDHWFRR